MYSLFKKTVQCQFDYAIFLLKFFRVLHHLSELNKISKHQNPSLSPWTLSALHLSVNDIHVQGSSPTESLSFLHFRLLARHTLLIRGPLLNTILSQHLPLIPGSLGTKNKVLISLSPAPSMVHNSRKDGREEGRGGERNFID